MKRLLAASSALILALSLFAPIIAKAQTFALPTGTLVRTFSDPKVWLIEDGKRRWVESEAAFRAQGFQDASIVYIPDAEIGRYTDGENVKADSAVVLPYETGYLPDLAPFAAEDVRIVKVGRQVQLKFTTTFWNRGKGALELRTKVPIATGRDAYYDAYQRVLNSEGSFRERAVGQLYWHTVHRHYHYVDFANYILELVRPVDGVSKEPSHLQKTTFCMRDDAVVKTQPDGARQTRTYIGCAGSRQGVSVGWADVYPYTLPDQFFDVTGLPAGVYRIRFDVDPDRRFIEGSRANNTSIALIDINPAKSTAKVLTFAAPFANNWNMYQEGLLVQAEGDNKVYIVNGGRKRWIPDETAFKSSGRSWSEIQVWPASLVDVIPTADVP